MQITTTVNIPTQVSLSESHILGLVAELISKKSGLDLCDYSIRKRINDPDGADWLHYCGCDGRGGIDNDYVREATEADKLAIQLLKNLQEFSKGVR